MIDPVQSLEVGALVVVGVVMIFVPARVAARQRQAHDRRVADRMARGSDAYFEELRSLQAYQPLKRIGAIRVVGLIFVIFGIACFYIDSL